MKDTMALARNAELHIVRRIEVLRKDGASASRTALLESLLDYTRRYLAGERGEIGNIVGGKLRYTGVAEDKETNGAILAFGYAILDEYDALHGKADA